LGDEINKKWNHFLDSLIEQGYTCIERKSDEVNTLINIEKEKVEIFFEVDNQSVKLCDDNEFKKYSIDLDTDSVYFELKVKNIVLDQLIQKRKVIFDSMKKNNSFSKLKKISIIHSIVSNEFDYFNCCNSNDFELSLLNEYNNCKTDAEGNVDLNLLKWVFIEQLLKGNLGDDNKINKLKTQIMNLKSEIESQKKHQLAILRKNSTTPLKTMSEWNVFGYEVGYNDSLINKLSRQLIEFENQLKKEREIADKKVIWYDIISIHKGIIVFPVADTKKDFYFEYDFRKDVLYNHEPLPINSYFLDQYNIKCLMLNQGNESCIIDTLQGKKVKETTLFYDGLGNVPGLSELIDFVGKMKLPDLLPVVVGKSIEPSSINKADKKGNKKHGFTYEKSDNKVGKKKELDTCCCCQSICNEYKSICINGKFFEVPYLFYKDNLNYVSSFCISKCGLLNISLFSKIFDFIDNENESFHLHQLNFEKASKKSYLYTNSYKFELNDLGGRKLNFELKDKKSNEVKKLNTIDVSKTYYITAGIGLAFNTGIPYQNVLNPSNGLFSREYLAKIKLTGGIKFFPWKTSIRQNLLSEKYSDNDKYSQLNKRNANFETKFFLYGGFTISDKPYEHLYFGAGYEPISGFAIMFFNRLSWVNKYRTDNGVIIETKGYTGWLNDRQFGFSILIDPKVAANIFAK
jgi:hypothetical protein